MILNGLSWKQTEIILSFVRLHPNRFKGLDLIDRVPHELWMEVCDIVQETGIKTIPEKKKCKISKMAV